MTSYLLLRDNKERGPFSLEQLIQVGFKPYDLVWIKGKSAAWRYPGEVEELKPYAPAIEEQPFDRFFKKKSDVKKIETPTAPQYKLMPKKNIHVIMPDQKTEMVVKEEPEQVSETIIIKENPAAAQVKYPEPIEEMKEVYTKNFQQRKQKIAKKNLVLQRMKKASVFLYMIALGILIGFTIKLKQNKKPITANEKANQIQSVVMEPAQNINTMIPIQEEKKVEPDKPIVKDELNLSNEINTSSAEKKITIEKNDLPVQKKETFLPDKKINTDQVSPGLDINPVTGERNKKSRTDDIQEQASSKNDISKMVSVKGNDYKRGVFGGIRDLQLTVTNNSKYILDNVIVELTYIKANDMPLKTDDIQFHSVAPNGSLTILIPPTSRGVKVTYKIARIESKELNSETAGL